MWQDLSKVIAFVGWVGCILSAHDIPKRPGIADSTRRIPIEALKPDAVFPVAGTPDWQVIGDHVWVSNDPKGTVSKLDPKSNQVLATIDVGKEPGAGLALGFGSLWIPCCGDSCIARLDIATDKVVARVQTPIAHSEGGLATGADSVWVLSNPKGELARIDPATNAVVAWIPVEKGSYACAFGKDALWITSTERSLLQKLDPRRNVITERIAVGKNPRFLAIGEGSVWTLNQGDGTVTRVDMATNKVVATIACGLPGGGGEIAVGEGSVWVTLFEYPLTRIDPRTNEVAQQFYGPGGDAVRVGHGSVWLSNLRQGNVWRLDARRIVATRKPE